MRYLSNEYKEGYVAFVFGLNHTENPYEQTEVQHFDWAAGWATAKLTGATKHPDELIDGPSVDTFIEGRTQVSKGDDELKAAAHYFVLTEYFAWLETVDPRIKEVALALDTAPPSGKIGASQQFYGQLESMLIARSKGGHDFVDMYTTLMSGPHGKHRDIHREDGARIWNIVTIAIENYFKKIAGKFNEN